MLRVLYVDDEKAVLNLGKIYLELSGELTVDTVLLVKDAEEQLGLTEYDAIISDYQMPVTNGIEFLKKLRSQGNKIPFILFTGKGREEVVIEALNNGADFYVQKGDDIETQFVDLCHKVLSAVARRKAEDALLRKTEELDRYFTDSMDLLCIADTDGYFRRLNPEWQRMLGFSIEELEGKQFLDLVHPEDVETTVNALNQLLDQNAVLNFVNRYRCKDGSYRWIEWRSYPKGKMIYAVARDITEHRRTEMLISTHLMISEYSHCHTLDELLQKTLDEAEALTESNIGFLHFVDDDQESLILQMWSTNTLNKMCTAEGKGLHYSISKAGVWVDCVHAREPVIHNDVASLPHLKGVPSGHVPVVRELVVPVIRHDKVVAILGVGNKEIDYTQADVKAVHELADLVWDITDRKRAEGRVEEAKSRAELYLNLLMHDITNYNTAAIGYLQLAQVRLNIEEKDEKLISQPLNVLKNSSELIANVRDLRRVETGQDLKEPIDLCRMLREVKEAFENPPGRDVQFILDLPESYTMMTSSGLLRDAFANIVSNAITHSSGSVTISISLRIEQLKGKNIVRLSFEDTGPGVPDDRKDKIFDRGMMGLTKGVSRGLGLYLVKRLVEDHDGQVWVEDRVPGDHVQGARFVLIMPVEPGNRADGPTPRQ